MSMNTLSMTAKSVELGCYFYVTSHLSMVLEPEYNYFSNVAGYLWSKKIKKMLSLNPFNFPLMRHHPPPGPSAAYQNAKACYF